MNTDELKNECSTPVASQASGTPSFHESSAHEGRARGLLKRFTQEQKHNVAGVEPAPQVGGVGDYTWAQISGIVEYD